MARKFELFGCCLGNGTTVCNKSVMEHGEYKTIAHISEGGHITWYIKNPESYVPEKDMKTINQWCKDARNKFMSYWGVLSDIRKYEIILDSIPFTVLLEHPLKEGLKTCINLHEKVAMLEKIYIENYI